MFSPGDGWLLQQLGLLRFGLPIDGNVGVGVFPEGEEILIGGLRLGPIACMAQARASCRRVNAPRSEFLRIF
jgi:hypothetical protein